MRDYQKEIGKTYGRLRITAFAYCQNQKRNLAICECVCGKIVSIRPYRLKNGITKSCGCYRDQRIKNMWRTRKKAKTTVWVQYKNEWYVLKHLVDYYKLNYATTRRHIKKFGFTFEQSLKIQRRYANNKIHR